MYMFQEPGSAPFAGRFFSDTAASLARVAMGFGCAVLVGLPLGIISGRLWWANDLMSLTVNGIRAIPGITWLPMAMIWFGVGTKTTVFLVALASFFPIYLNTAAGAAQINPILLRAAAMMGIRGYRFVFGILIPASMSHILTGLRLGLGIAWAYLVLGELTGVSDGLGAVIMDARMLGQVNIIVVGMILIGVIGRLTDVLLVKALRLTVKSVRRMNPA
jgi:NitT/TauT family transport system permease protein